MSEVKTMQGSYLQLDYRNADTVNEELLVNSAKTIALDVGANSGILHIVDQVLEIPTVAVASPSKGTRNPRITPPLQN